MNEEDDINQSQIKEKLIKFSNQSPRHYSDIDTTAVEQSQKFTEYKSISVKQVYQDVWKNPLTDIPKHTAREQNYSNIFNPQSSYDRVYRESYINHQHLFSPIQLENRMEGVKSVDAWIGE